MSSYSNLSVCACEVYTGRLDTASLFRSLYVRQTPVSSRIYPTILETARPLFNFRDSLRAQRLHRF